MSKKNKLFSCYRSLGTCWWI